MERDKPDCSLGHYAVRQDDHRFPSRSPVQPQTSTKHLDAFQILLQQHLTLAIKEHHDYAKINRNLKTIYLLTECYPPIAHL